MAEINPAPSDRQFNVTIERLERRHVGIMLAFGRERPAVDMRFYWQVNETADYDGERASALWPRRSPETVIAADVAKTQSAALTASTKALREALRR